MAAVAIAFALAFGLGGQDAARRWLARGESSVTTAAAQLSAQQIRDNTQNEMRQSEQARVQQQAQAQVYKQPAQDMTQPFQAPQAQPYPQQQPYAPPPNGMPPVEPSTYDPRTPR